MYARPKKPFAKWRERMNNNDLSGGQSSLAIDDLCAGGRFAVARAETESGADTARNLAGRIGQIPHPFRAADRRGQSPAVAQGAGSPGTVFRRDRTNQQTVPLAATRASCRSIAAASRADRSSDHRDLARWIFFPDRLLVRAVVPRETGGSGSLPFPRVADSRRIIERLSGACR